MFEFEYLFTYWVESQQTVDTSSKKVSCLADSENQFFFKIAFFCQLPILFKCNFFNYNVLLWRYYYLYKECTELHASRAFVHYVPYVLSYNCFLCIFLFLRAFNFLRTLRALTFYVPYLTSFFTCFKFLFFFACLTCPYFLRALLNVFITCLTCLTFLHFFIKYGATHNQPSQAGMSINEVEQTKNSK